MAQTDHLGRETATTSPKVQSVTGFAVEQGTLDSDAEGVQDTLREEERRRKEHTEHAERVSRQMAPAETERSGE
jgi:hypothetical protein